MKAIERLKQVRLEDKLNDDLKQCKLESEEYEFDASHSRVGYIGDFTIGSKADRDFYIGSKA